MPGLSTTGLRELGRLLRQEGRAIRTYVSYRTPKRERDSDSEIKKEAKVKEKRIRTENVLGGCRPTVDDPVLRPCAKKIVGQLVW